MSVCVVINIIVSKCLMFLFLILMTILTSMFDMRLLKFGHRHFGVFVDENHSILPAESVFAHDGLLTYYYWLSAFFD